MKTQQHLELTKYSIKSLKKHKTTKVKNKLNRDFQDLPSENSTNDRKPLMKFLNWDKHIILQLVFFRTHHPLLILFSGVKVHKK